MRLGRRELFTSVFGLAAVSPAAQGQQGGITQKKIHYRGAKPEATPLFSSAVSYGNLLFIAGKGAHFEGDIKAHTNHVLNQVQEELENAGSSMEKVLKRNIPERPQGLPGNERGVPGTLRLQPPVRTTIAAAGGIPGKSLVEIDVIAYL